MEDKRAVMEENVNILENAAGNVDSAIDDLTAIMHE